MNKQTKIFLVVIAVIVGFFALVLMSDSKPTANVPTNPLVYPTTAPRVKPTKVVDRLPDAYSREFMANCNADGTVGNYCQCALDYMHDALGTEGLVRISMQYLETKVMPEIMVKAATNCLDRL